MVHALRTRSFSMISRLWFTIADRGLFQWTVTNPRYLSAGSYRQSARSDGNVTAISTSHRVRVPTTIRMRDLQIQSKHLAPTVQEVKPRSKSPVYTICPSAGSLLRRHYLHTRPPSLPGDSRPMIATWSKPCGNSPRRCASPNHGARSDCSTNTTQRTQRGSHAHLNQDLYRPVKNQQIDPPSTHGRYTECVRSELEHHLAFAAFDAEFTHQ